MAHLPEFHESSVPAIRLLQGAVYADDSKTWDLLMTNRSRLETYFGRVGLIMVVDEPEGFAYLRQIEEEELPDGYDGMPKLIRRSRLGYDVTLFSVMLRDELRRFEEQNVDSERCVVDTSELQTRMMELLPDTEDEVRVRRKFDQLMVRAQELGFLRKLNTQPVAYEIRPIIKARITAERLDELKQQFQIHAETIAAQNQLPS
tara:strand:- start:934 stop:1542 length:609 start_codon:yes stop_codon:yes gene_type:complete